MRDVYKHLRVVVLCVLWISCLQTRTYAQSRTWYQDYDNDGFGNPAISTLSASQPGGYVLNGLDCNDSSANSIGWANNGNAGFSAGATIYNSIAIDTTDNPVVVYRDASVGGKATAMKYSGGSWTTLGSAGFTPDEAFYTSIAVTSTNVPYVVYRDNSVSLAGSVKKFSGGSWSQVGSAGFTTYGAKYTSIAIGPNDTPYVAYVDDGSLGNERASVMKFDGTAWSYVGSPSFGFNKVEFTDLTFNSAGEPYIVYSDWGNSHKATVRRFDGSGWVAVGSPGFSADTAYYTNIVIGKADTPYVVYEDMGNNRKATVMKFDGTNWVTVGSAGFSADTAEYTSIAVDSNGKLYVAYRDKGYSNKVTVMTFNGSTWAAVGYPAISGNVAYYTALAVDRKKVPFVGFSDNNAAGKATVMRIAPEPFAPVIDSITASVNPVCSGTNTTLYIHGSLNDAAVWKWYKGGCGDTLIGSGDSVVVNPLTARYYYVRGEGGCLNAPGRCDSILINMQVPVALTLDPVDKTICETTNTIFNVGATGAGLTYQWQVNTGSGFTNLTNAAPYSNVTDDTLTVTAAAASMNGYTYRCIVNGTCTPGDTSAAATLSIDTAPAVTAAPVDTAICQGTNAGFSVSATGTNLTYQWQVNTGSGFTNLTNVAPYSNVTTAAMTITAATVGMSTYQYRCVVSGTCSPAATSTAAVLTVNPNLTPSVSINANPGNTICDGTSVTFTATPTNGGAAPAYQWKINGANVGTNSNTYTTSALVNADAVTCVLTSNATCLAVATATSNTINMTVNPNLTPAVSLSANPGSTICAGTSVTFTAIPTNGGAAPSYQWKLNGTNVGTNSNTYTNAALVTGDVVTCVLTSNATCLAVATATSSGITMTVNPNLTPSVSIGVFPNDTLCAGTLAVFTATPTNGGTTPAYQWKLNGTNVGIGTNVYSTTGLANGDVVSCVMTSNEACLTVATATSNSVAMVVNPILTPSVTIAANPGNTICAGTSVTFTATPVNGGTAPTYQWKVNGVLSGLNSPTYTTSSLANTDAVSCVIISNESCLSVANDTSNTITMTVNPNLTPAVSISANPGSTICAGTSVTFTATPTNGGAAPSYQWKLNGVNVGTNSTTYTNASLVNTDVVTCVLTSNATCLTVATATSNSITMTVNPNLTPDVTISANPGSTICAGTSVTFTATPTNGGASPAYQWKVNGTNVGTNSNTYTSAALANTDIVTCVLTSNATCLAVATATSNSITMTVNPNLTPAVSISANPGSTICAGTSVTFTATPTNGGTVPAYQWKVNGTNVGTNSNTYTSSILNNTDVVTCVLTSNETCVTTATATSNSITMTVNPNLTPAVSISANPGSTICAGTSVTFTATPTNGGASPAYQWKVNGTNVGTNSNTYTSAALANTDIVTCVLTSNATCLAVATATSNSITMTVNPNLTPAVSISANPGSTICAGTSVTFTATPTNGGTTPAYQWKVNGTNVGTNSNTYTSSILNNTDVVTCVLTSNETCVTIATATSNSITMTVNPNLTPAVSISANPGSTICAGTSVTFTATPTNGGASPAYQWKVNGTNVGTNSNTYTSAALVNTDVVTCVLTSNATCLAVATATSNSITMTVNPNLTPAVSISANPGSTICAGTSVTFTATPTNGGTTPAYQWKVNGANVGTNSNTYTSSILNNTDVVTCVLTSNETCVTTATATSNSITMTVNPNLTPAVTITANPGSTICAGSSATFTATPLNGGTTPAYQWKVNGTNVGTNSNTYTTTTLANTDVVTCVLTSNETCVTTATATSNSITMTVNPNLTPAVSISANPGSTICAGTSVTFTATPTNGGASPIYQWKVNGANVGTSSNTYTSAALANTDVVTCVLTSNATCLAVATATSNSITMTVNPNLTPAVSISVFPSDTICAGTLAVFTATPVNGGATPAYQWKVNGVNAGIGTNLYSSTGLSNGDVVSCVLTSNATCLATPTATSNTIGMTVKPVLTPSVTIAVNPGNTICAGTSVTFTATPVNGGTAPTYQWKINGSIVGANNPVYTSTTMANADVVNCVIISNEACLSVANDTSNSITMTVNPNLMPAVSITANPGSTICAGTSVTFTATPTNGGTTPAYQWKLNGVNVGTNSTTYTSSSLVNTDVVTCVLTSNATCLAVPTGTSNTITMTVNPNLTPSVSIGSTATTICAGTSVTFTATPANGGSSPSYQWKVNGTNVGTNSNTYTSTTLANTDVVSCVLTSNATCLATPTATSGGITMTVNPLIAPSVSISASPGTTVCALTNVTFTALATNAGTTPAYQWKVNGTNVGTNSPTYSNGALVSGDIVTCEVTSNATCASPVNATSNSLAMTVNPLLTPTVSIAASATTICAGSSVVFTATPVNGGTTPAYQWKVNGSNVGTNSSTYTTAALANTDVVSCVLTSNATCATPTGATSNSIAMTVNALQVPVVSIAASATTICAGSSVTFTATPTNGGATPAYQWKVNGSNVGTNSNTYTSTTLNNADAVTCVLTSNATCATPASVTSNTVTMTVNPNLTPAVSIGATATTICAGSSVTFTATPTNGGTTPSYQWKLNGVNVGTNSTTYTSSTLANGDAITCVITSNATCLAVPTGTSNSITMIVNPIVVPSVSISASSTNICAGSTVNFTATATNGGLSPAYQWKVNGTNVGTNAATYSSSTLANGAVVTCVLTSVANCASPINATSNSVTITVNPLLTPSVSISTNPGTTICAGTSVTFTATPTNGGTTPSYQWKVNGTNVGTNANTYTSTTLNNADVVTCVLTSNATCATPANATSNSVTMTVNPILTPAVSISASATVICASTSVTFTATPTNGGTAPAYQWKKNGVNVGTNGTTYTVSSLANGDVITCVLTTSVPCPTSATATSNSITMTVNPFVVPSVSISSSTGNQGCSGVASTFTATAINGGTAPAYQWKKNGINVGVNNNVYADNGLVTGDVISCVLTSNAQCAIPSTATSNSISMTITLTTQATIALLASPDSVGCTGDSVTFYSYFTNGGTTPQFQWLKNGVLLTGETKGTYNTKSLVNGDFVQCQLTSSNTCVFPVVSKGINMQVDSVYAPVVTASSDKGTVVAKGELVTFSAVMQHCGSNPKLQWVKNGIMLPGETNSSYQTSDIKDGDEIWLEVNTSTKCVTTQFPASNKLKMGLGLSVANTKGVFNALELYPNPNNGLFTVHGTIDANVKNRGVKVEVLNSLGQQVYSTATTIANGEINLKMDVQSFADGMYMIRLTADGVSQNLRFSLQR